MQISLLGETPDNPEWDRDSWCTPPEFMEAVHRFWPDGIDLDPCSNAWAQSLGFVRARTAWTKDDDCTTKRLWPGRTCWLQPPYSKDGAPIIRHACDRWDEGQMFELLALVRLDTSTEAWGLLAERAASLALPVKRVKHYEQGQRKDSTNFCSGVMLLTRLDKARRHADLQQAFDGLARCYQ